MSLERVFDKAKTQKILDVMPDEMIVWKVVVSPEYEPDGYALEPVWHSAFARGVRGQGRLTAFAKQGLSLATKEPMPCGGSVRWGFHSFVKAISATWLEHAYWNNRAIPHWHTVTALVKKEWITTLGVEGQNNIVIVSSKIHMPTYPNTDITKELGQIETPDVERVEALAEII